MRALGSDSVDFRTRQSDFSLDGKRAGAPWLGMKIADIARLDRVLVVHGQDGMDELTTTTNSWAASLEGGKVREIEIAPEDAGVARATMDKLKGGDAAHNADAIRQVLAGRRDAFRDIVVLNSAAALMVAGKAGNLKDGAAMAVESIDGGKARKALELLQRICA